MLYQVLLNSRQAVNLIPHQPFLKPMLDLLTNFGRVVLKSDLPEDDSEKMRVSSETEFLLVKITLQKLRTSILKLKYF